MSLPQLPISRWLPFWQLRPGGQKEVWTYLVCVWRGREGGGEVQPQGQKSLWTHCCETAAMNFRQDDRLLRLQDNPTSVVFLCLVLTSRETFSSFPFGTSASLVSVLSTFASLPLSVVVFFCFEKVKRPIYCEGRYVVVFFQKHF